MNPYLFILVIYAKLYKTLKSCDDIAQNAVPCPCKDEGNLITLLNGMLCNMHIFRSETPLVVDVDYFLVIFPWNRLSFLQEAQKLQEYGIIFNKVSKVNLP